MRFRARACLGALLLSQAGCVSHNAYLLPEAVAPSTEEFTVGMDYTTARQSFETEGNFRKREKRGTFPVVPLGLRVGATRSIDLGFHAFRHGIGIGGDAKFVMARGEWPVAIVPGVDIGPASLAGVGNKVRSGAVTSPLLLGTRARGMFFVGSIGPGWGIGSGDLREPNLPPSVRGPMATSSVGVRFPFGNTVLHPELSGTTSFGAAPYQAVTLGLGLVFGPGNTGRVKR